MQFIVRLATAFAHTDVVMLNHDTLLYPHHLDTERRYEFAPVAEITQRNPQVWGLRNRSHG